MTDPDSELLRRYDHEQPAQPNRRSVEKTGTSAPLALTV